MPGWPPTWDKPHFKEGTSTKVERYKRRMDLKNKEDAEKQKVRRRDKYCRFPLCGCGKMKLRTDVSHSQHKGMGGNPAGDRSKADLMLLVCGARHKDNIASIDKGNLRWRPLTARGSNGPVAWDLHVQMIERSSTGFLATDVGIEWIELAVETAPHQYKTLKATQAVLLKWLSGMDV